MSTTAASDQSSTYRAPSPSDIVASADDSTGLAPYLIWMLLVYFVLEYIRPPGIVDLRIQMAMILVFPLLWLRADEKPWRALLTAQLLFLGFAALQVPFAHNTFNAYKIVRALFGTVVVAVALSWIMSRRDHLRLGLWGWVLVMLYVALYALGHGGKGPGGYLGDENDLGLACITALPVPLFATMLLSGWKRWASMLMVVVFGAAIVVSNSRGAFVALAAVGFYCLLIAKHKIRNFALLVGAVCALVAFAPSEYFDEIKTITDTNEGTAKARQFLWTSAYNMWLDHKLMGVGVGNFPHLVGIYQPGRGMGFDSANYQERNWGGTVTHSLYFEVLSEHGVLGVALMGFMGWSQLMTVRRVRRDVREQRRAPPDLQRDTEMYGCALAAGCIGFAVAGLFLSVTYYPYFWYFGGFVVALDASIRRELVEYQPAPGRSTEH